MEQSQTPSKDQKPRKERQMKPTFLKDLSAALAEMPVITKDAENNFVFEKTGRKHFYITYQTLRNAVVDVLRKHNLELYHRIDMDRLITTIIHIETGEDIVSASPLCTNDPQKRASEITYYKRYHVEAMCNIAGSEDDDGEGAMQRQPAAVGQSAGTQKQSHATQETRPPQPPQQVTVETPADAATFGRILGKMTYARDIQALESAWKVDEKFISALHPDAKNKLIAASQAREQELKEQGGK